MSSKYDKLRQMLNMDIDDPNGKMVSHMPEHGFEYPGDPNSLESKAALETERRLAEMNSSSGPGDPIYDNLLWANESEDISDDQRPYLKQGDGPDGLVRVNQHRDTALENLRRNAKYNALRKAIKGQ